MESSEIVVLNARPQGERGVVATIYSEAKGLLTMMNYRAQLPGFNGNLQSLLSPLSILQVNYTLRYGSSTLGQIESVEGRVGSSFYATGILSVVQLLVSELFWHLLRLGGEGVPQSELYSAVREAAYRFPLLDRGQSIYFPSCAMLSLLCAMGYRPRGEYEAQTPYLHIEHGTFGAIPPMGTEARRKAFSTNLSSAWQKMLTFGYDGLRGLGDPDELLVSVVRYAEHHLQQSIRPKSLPLFLRCVGGL